MTQYKNTDHYYHLRSTGMSACAFTEEYYEYARSTWLCAECGSPMPGTTSVDVRIQERTPPEKPLTFVHCVPIIHRALLNSIGLELVRTYLYIGKVFGPTGMELEDWVTFRGHQRVIVRGSKSASYRQCCNCGQILYFAMGKRYLYPRPADDAAIYESDLSGLVVRPELLRRVHAERWPQLGVEKLPVVGVPWDNLPELVG